MANAVTATASFFANLLSKLRGQKPPDPQDPNYGLPEGAFQAQTGAQLAPIGFDPDEEGSPKPQPKPSASAPSLTDDVTPYPREETPREKALYGQADQALSTLSKAPPALIQPQVNPIAEIAATAVGMGVHGSPGAQSRVFNTPVALAGQEANAANAQAQAAFADSQRGAQSTLEYVNSALGHELSRDAVTARIDAALKLQDVKSRSSEALANIKAMPKFWQTLAQYGAGLGSDGVSTALTQMGITDPDVNSAVTQGIVTDPSAPLLLKKAQIEVNADKVDATERANLRKMLTASNSTPHDRLDAIMKLADMGDPLFAGMDYPQMVVASQVEGAQTKLDNQKALDIQLTRPQRMANLVKTGNLIDARVDAQKETAALDKIREKYLGPVMAAQASKYTAEASKADAAANAAIYGYHNKPVTATAYFTAINATKKAVDSASALVGYDQAEHNRIQTEIGNIQAGHETVYDKSGNSSDALTQAKLTELQQALESNETVTVYHQALLKRNQDRLTSMQQEAEPGKGPSEGSKPTHGAKYTQAEIDEAHAAINAMPDGPQKTSAIKSFEHRTGAKF